jgi:lipopolysaccharide biosynthesis regulator YciM
MREQAVFELAQDFLKAGLFDRADQAFERLAAGSFADQAARHRIEIAETMRDWARAIELSERVLEVDRTDSDRIRIAHFHCELAARALASGEPERFRVVEHHLASAERHHAQHPRVIMLRGDLALARGEAARAIEAWRALLSIAPAHFNLVAARWVAAQRESGGLEEAIQTLDRQGSKHPSAELFLQGFAARLAQGRGPAAADWAAEVLARSPSLAGLAQLLRWRIDHAAHASIEELRLSERLIAEQAQLQSRHVCGHCGFRARQYFWQCPGCGRWDSVSPLRAEDPNQ